MPATRLRFLFSAADMSRIDPASVIVEDVPAIANGVTAGFTMRIRFHVTNPAAGAPRIQPLFPGTLTFLADPTQPGVIPDPATDVIDNSTYDDWRTTGSLMVTRLLRLSTPLTTAALLVEPTHVWCSPVRMTRDFLFESLLHHLPVTLNVPGVDLRDEARKERYVIAGFLAGTCSPAIRQNSGANAALDDVAAVQMPEVIMSPGGDVVLDIAVAHSPRSPRDGKLKPRDGELGRLDALAPGLAATSPLHPANGSLPARLVYRELRGMFVEPATPVMDAMLPGWPQAPRLLPLRFTRIWKPQAECSVHLPRQNVLVTDTAGSTLLRQRIPHHGIVYLCQPMPANGAAAPPPPVVRIEIEGGMRWLDGALPKLWQIKGGLDPVTFDLSMPAIPHVVMRLPMSEAMLSDETRSKAINENVAVCTYVSLRRTIRAWVDNRIAGGRLTYGVKFTAPDTLPLIEDAIPNAANLAKNQPDPDTTPNACYPFFKDTLAGLFPGDAPLFTNEHPGSPSPKRPLYLVMWDLWQSLWDTDPLKDPVSNPASRDYYSDEHVGHGSAGAMVQMGLAAYHHLPLRRNPGESDTDFATRLDVEKYSGRIALALQDGLMPGALVQYWWTSREYVLRSSRSREQDNGGHSLIFESYEPDATSLFKRLRLIDGGGVETETVYMLHHSTPYMHNPVWITANWTE